MSLWDKIGGPAAIAPRLDGRFSTEEVARLTNLRSRVERDPIHLDLGIEARRLEFARWLIEHGRLNEGAVPTSPPSRWERVMS